MNNVRSRLLTLLAGSCLLLLTLAIPDSARSQGAAKSAVPEWKFEVLHLKNGRSIQGMLVEETTRIVRFHYVRRNPGVPTVAILTTFQRAEVARIERLGSADRLTLEKRLRALDPENRDERVRLERIELKPCTWGSLGEEGLSYQSAYFVLVSNARTDIVLRAALRLEEIFAAYARFVPPRHPTAAPTRIRLVRSLAEYQTLLREEKRAISNPAFFDAARNEVTCASDLQRLDELLEDARRQHDAQLTRIRRLEGELKTLKKGPVRERLVKQVQESRKAIAAANAQNNLLFRTATARLFEMLYHEAFHAYLANFVYREDPADVPRWLNEGLAQIFETALVEAGELRVGHADKERLERVKAAVRKGELIALADLLEAGPKQFLVAHVTDQQVSDRTYLGSWALAFHLTFERRLLGTPRMDAYIRARKQGTDARKAFSDLVGQPLAEFEKTFHHYLLGLRQDGTTASAPK